MLAILKERTKTKKKVLQKYLFKIISHFYQKLLYKTVKYEIALKSVEQENGIDYIWRVIVVYYVCLTEWK